MVDYRSAEAADYRRLYKSKAWQDLRARQLFEHPLCERCEADGKLTTATVANHRRPHKGDLTLFFNPSNLESTCKPHHDGTIQREERLGMVIGCDAQGRPLDPNHPWNRP